MNTGPVYENVMEGDAVDVNKLPTPQWHEGDGGNYIGTECVIIVKDPDNDWVNLGTYRVSVREKTNFGTAFMKSAMTPCSPGQCLAISS